MPVMISLFVTYTDRTETSWWELYAGLFMLAIPCVGLCICSYACWAVSMSRVLYVWGDWVEVDLGSEMDMTEEVGHYPWNRSPVWFMTCVAFCLLENLSWFVQSKHCYCFNFIIIIIVYVWQWASCQPQCPPSQFHCPLCSHMGALQHFSTLFDSTEPRMHCEEQHKVEATLPGFSLSKCYAYRHSILGHVLVG